ncbi:MAG: hypothetical protein RBR62_05940, partial [Bacteroidales bacterium]|nr:hypothetical protein [Bacteroidales bacterium]
RNCFLVLVFLDFIKKPAFLVGFFFAHTRSPTHRAPTTTRPPPRAHHHAPTAHPPRAQRTPTRAQPQDGAQQLFVKSVKPQVFSTIDLRSFLSCAPS